MKTFREMSRQEEREQAVNNAVSIIRQDYYEDVTGAAEGIIEEAKIQYKKGKGLTGEDLRESVLEGIHETIDSQRRVIYTFQAQLGLLVSDNSGAYVEEYGPEGATSEGDLNWSVLMFAAMEQDVMEKLNDMDFDVNDPEEYFEEEEE